MKLFGIQLAHPTPDNLSLAAVNLAAMAAVLVGAAHSGLIPNECVWPATLACAVGELEGAYGLSMRRGLLEFLLAAGLIILAVGLAAGMRTL